MNGVTAQSLRDKGVNYHLNWGVSLQHLQEMTAEIKADLTDVPSGELLTPPLGEVGRGSLFTLSSLLWKENIRECKILATMLMPADTFPADLAMLWVEQTPTQEIAELAAKTLLDHGPYAAYAYIGAKENPFWSLQRHHFFKAILGSILK